MVKHQKLGKNLNFDVIFLIIAVKKICHKKY